jgi:hypothetical protein
MKLRRRHRKPAQRLRAAIEAMPRRSREAMLRGIARNRIIAGAYWDRSSGGICPMLAAHRSGGRTDLASFARAWDCYTGAKRPRPARERELRALRSYLELSLIDEEPTESIREAAARLRAERQRARRAEAVRPARASRGRTPTGERDRRDELGKREGWSWTCPARRYDTYRRRVAVAARQAERAGELSASGGQSCAEGSAGRL